MDTTKIKAALEEKLKELEERARRIQKDLSAKPNQDWNENAMESEGDEVLANLGEATVEDIRDIKLALSRIENGEYGNCVSCHGSISHDRLLALPSATQCIKCAS